jgi:hypothetical protein
MWDISHLHMTVNTGKSTRCTIGFGSATPWGTNGTEVTNAQTWRPIGRPAVIEFEVRTNQGWCDQWRCFVFVTWTRVLALSAVIFVYFSTKSLDNTTQFYVCNYKKLDQPRVQETRNLSGCIPISIFTVGRLLRLCDVKIKAKLPPGSGKSVSPQVLGARFPRTRHRLAPDISWNQSLLSWSFQAESWDTLSPYLPLPICKVYTTIIPGNLKLKGAVTMFTVSLNK